MVGGLNSYVSTNGGANWTINSGWVSSLERNTLRINYIHADHQIDSLGRKQNL